MDTTTTSKDTLYNNRNGVNDVVGLVVSFMRWGLTCMSFFEILEGVEVMVVVVIVGREVRYTWFEHITIFYDISTTSVQSGSG